jgi:putative nucleotidyltransferase with HDIG domain
MSLERLLEVIRAVAAGRYSNDIMELTTPEHPEPIRTIAEAVGLMMVKVEAREYRLTMLVEDLERLNERIRANAVATVTAMARALGARNPNTRGHVERVAVLAERLARRMGLQESEVQQIRLGGLLHDVGKIGFPDRLFDDHAEKNPPEVVREILKHPAVGASILEGLDFLGPALEYIHCHHERADGKGYPRGLKGDEIPLGARILAVADAFDAMTSRRPYQATRSHQEALGELRRHTGTHWDGRCIAAFAKVVEDLADAAVEAPPADGT